jgi:cell division transport system permease protein
VMLRWFFVSPAERRLLGLARLGGPTPWVIAIMTFSIMLIAATGLALASTAALVSRAIEARYALQVPAGAGDAGALVQAVRSSPGVTSVEAVTESDMRRTLEQWLGPAAQSAELPVPALINFDAPRGTDLIALQRRVQAITPSATIVAHRDSVGPLLHSLRLLKWVAFGLVLLLSIAASAAVVLAARGALDTHRFTIEVMHGIGATDLQVTHLFQRKILIDAFIGSVAGAFAAALVLLLLASGAAIAGELTGGATLGLVDIIILALLPLALTVLATWVARTAVLRTLRQAL